MHNLASQKSFDQILSLCLTASVSSFPIEKFSLKIRSKQIHSRAGLGFRKLPLTSLSRLVSLLNEGL